MDQWLVDLGLPTQVALAGWKALLLGRRLWDERVGARIVRRRVARWAREWLTEWGDRGFRTWLERSGAGELWIDVSEGPEWARRTYTPADARVARQAVQGVFDLLGSGPVQLGNPPLWRTDLYTKREWPLDPAHRLELIQDDGSDIRTVWELGRCYHFIPLARTYHATGNEDFPQLFSAHVDSWIEQNPYGLGPNWASPMDVAIRASNWALAAVLFAGSPSVSPEFWARLLAQLRLAGRHVDRYREWHPRFRGNHYVANGVGLTYIGALFRDDRHGRKWLRRGGRLLSREIFYQTHPDGPSFESSLEYHRFATHLFTWGSRVLKRNLEVSWGAAQEARLTRMYDFMAAYLPPSGEAPNLGDGDNGHLHLMDAAMLTRPRRHRLGLPNDRFPAGVRGPELFAKGGFAVLRSQADHCIVRCGGVGIFGAGSHDHNDQLSFELVIAGERVVRDSGTYCYTRDLSMRAYFRSTAAHNAIQVSGAEQNPIRVDRPWRILADRTRSRVTEWRVEGNVTRFTGEHHGFVEITGGVVQRTVELDVRTNRWTIVDRVTGDGEHEVAWRLHLAPEIHEMEGGPGHTGFRAGPARFRIEHPDILIARVQRVPSSDRYGVLVQLPVLILEGQVVLPASITTVVQKSGEPSTGASS